MAIHNQITAAIIAAAVSSAAAAADPQPPYITNSDTVEGFQAKMTASTNFKYEFIMAQGQTVSRNPAVVEQFKSAHDALRQSVYAPGTKVTGNDEDAYPQSAPENLTAVSGTFRAGITQGSAVMNYKANPTAELSRGLIKTWGPVYHGSTQPLEVTPFYKTMEDCGASFKAAAEALKSRRDVVLTGECYGPDSTTQGYTATGGVTKMAPR